MQKDGIFFLENIYSKHLSIINEVTFTRREIDVIACLLNARRTSQIASILSISPKTVTTHFRNIMLKGVLYLQDGIINFIEKSSQHTTLRKYYTNLVIQTAFERSLREISKIKRENIPAYLAIYCKDSSLKNFLIQHLSAHLKRAAIRARVLDREYRKEVENEENPNEILLLFLEKKEQIKIPHAVPRPSTLNLSEEKSYYLAVFEILRKLFPEANLDEIVTKFKTRYKSFHQISKNLNQREEEKHRIRSDVVLPTEPSFVIRSELISQIDDKFKESTGEIQSVALVGPGGAGKTTLARQFSFQQESSVMWEMNAETPISLLSSFENLAQAFAQTEKDKTFLRELEIIKDAEVKRKKIIQFVKEHLNFYSNWCLIFDNVEKFEDIQRYFPQDFMTWGRGKIILTTRNSNVENNKHINKFVRIGELSYEQKEYLFIKIVTRQNEISLAPSQIKEVKAFLEHIPSFPLDISVAAYYLNATNVSYNAYLERIVEYNKDFNKIQQDLLKEAGEYTDTRYGIVSLSLQHIVNSHKDFSDLLLFISLINSQNIPKKLLDKCKMPNCRENFIYNLKKYSLVTSEGDVSTKKNASFFIHRSTQAIALTYLTKLLDLEKNKHPIENICLILRDYSEEILSQEDLSEANLFIKHLESLLSHSHLLTSFLFATISSELGIMYRDICHYDKSRQLFERSLEAYKENYYKAPLLYARSLAGLGTTYRQLGNYQKAITLLEKSLTVYKENFYKNHPECAWTLARLGTVYREENNYKKAIQLFEESITIYRTNSYEYHLWFAWCLASLGSVYKELGHYDKAKQLLEESLVVYRKNSRNHHPWCARALGWLGVVYRELAEYEKSRKFLEESLFIYKKNSTSSIHGLLEL